MNYTLNPSGKLLCDGKPKCCPFQTVFITQGAAGQAQAVKQTCGNDCALFQEFKNKDGATVTAILKCTPTEILIPLGK